MSRIVGLLTLVSMWIIVGCAKPGLPPPPDTGPMSEQPYVIGHADVIQISVWDHPTLGTTVPVRPDGMISVPLLDDVRAAGLTPIELKEVLARSLTEFISNPDVTVIVRAVNSKRAFMIGEIPRQGPIFITQDTRILDALAMAGGFTAFADKNEVRILRKNGSGGLDEYRFDYEAYIDGDADGTNLLVLPGDTIVVPD